MSIDSKGRLFLPPVFRDAFADGGVFTTRKGKVVLFTDAGYAEVEVLMRALRDNGQFDRPTFDALFGSAASVQPDSQGRVTIPRQMRERFGLDGPVTMLGTDECLSIFRATEAPTANTEILDAAYETLSALGL